MFFSDEMLQSIREKIACPQFGDNHYGEWGTLNLNQRRTIRGLLDYIEMLKAERGKLIYGMEYKKVIIALKTQIDLADLNKTTVATEVPLSTFTDALLLINNLVTEINKQQAEIERLQSKTITSNNKQQAEIERLQSKTITSLLAEYKNLCNDYAIARTEAIKELANKTNEMITEIYNKHIFGNNDLNDEEKDAFINFLAILQETLTTL